MLSSRTVAKSPERVPLPPPTGSSGAYSSGTKSFKSSSFQQSTTTYPGYDSTPSAAPSVPSTSWDSQVHCQNGMISSSESRCYLLVNQSNLLVYYLCSFQDLLI